MSIAAAARLFLSEGRDEEFVKLVRRIPVADLDDRKMENMMIRLLLPCLDFENKYACQAVITEFNVDEQLDILTRIFTFKSFTDDLLAFVVRCHPGKTAAEHYANLIGYEESSVCSFAAMRIDKIFDKIYGNVIPTDKYIELFNYACDDQNNVMIEVLQNRIRTYNVEAESPPWLKVNKTNNWDIPEPPENNFRLPEDDEESIELLLKVLGSGNINLDTEPKKGRKKKIPATDEGESFQTEEDDRQIEIEGEDEISEYAETSTIVDPAIVTAFKRMDNDQKKDTLEAAFEQHRINLLFENKKYNRLLGPANIQSGGTFFDKSHRCYKYGGCRMLICTCSEESDNQEQSESQEIEWYTGACDRCFRVLPARSHCIREPLLDGGWRGCYCTSSRDDNGKIIRGYCLKSMLYTTDPQINEIIDNNIDQYLDILERDGIYDRRNGHNQIVAPLTQNEFNFNYLEKGYPDVDIVVEFYDEHGRIEENQDISPRGPGEITLEDLGEKTILDALLSNQNPLPVSQIANISP